MTQNKEYELLIVEDNVAEAIYAQTEAARAGFRRFLAVTTLDDALNYLPKAEKVVSDLFFPAGRETKIYSDRFLPAYEKFRVNRFQSFQGAELVRRAITVWAEIFGEENPTPEKGLDYYEKHVNNLDAGGRPNSLLRAVRDAVRNKQDSDKYDAYLKIEEDIRTGKNLPLGIIVAEEARNLGLPVQIVTSTYHHEDIFEPIASLIPCSYIDMLIEGRKDWKKGLQKLLGGSK